MDNDESAVADGTPAHSMEAKQRRTTTSTSTSAKATTDPFELSPQDYLAKAYIPIYLTDAMTLLISARPEAPLEFLSDYFTSVRRGTHILFRDYDYIRATPRNRSSFVRVFWETFKHIHSKELLRVDDLHELVRLLCPNFPLQVTLQAASNVLLDDALDTLMTFSDFARSFQLQVFHEEFLERCKEIFSSKRSTSSSESTAAWKSTKCQDTANIEDEYVEQGGEDGGVPALEVQHLLPAIKAIVRSAHSNGFVAPKYELVKQCVLVTTSTTAGGNRDKTSTLIFFQFVELLMRSGKLAESIRTYGCMPLSHNIKRISLSNTSGAIDTDGIVKE